MLNLLSDLIQKISNKRNSSEKEKEELFTEMADTSCAKFTFYIREDGEFAITSEFFREDEEVAEITSTVLHMINSGMLAEYFVKSLKLWGENAKAQKFTSSIITQWKNLFEEDKELDGFKEGLKEFEKKYNKLAVDPSDVFGLKSLKD